MNSASQRSIVSTPLPFRFTVPLNSHIYRCLNIPAINRLDRLTSGLMIIPLSADRARELTKEFVAGTVQKEYVARCKGRFPE